MLRTGKWRRFISSNYWGRLASSVEQRLNLIGAFAFLLMMFLTTADVSGRYLFNRPIPGGMEFVEWLMVMGIFLGLAYTQKVGGHVRMDLFITRVLKGRSHHAIEAFTLFLSLLIYTLILFYSLKYTIMAVQMPLVSRYLHLPQWPYLLCVPLGSLFLCVRFAVELIRHLGRVRGGE